MGAVLHRRDGTWGMAGLHHAEVLSLLTCDAKRNPPRPSATPPRRGTTSIPSSAGCRASGGVGSLRPAASARLGRVDSGQCASYVIGGINDGRRRNLGVTGRRTGRTGRETGRCYGRWVVRLARPRRGRCLSGVGRKDSRRSERQVFEGSAEEHKAPRQQRGKARAGIGP